MRNSSWQKSSYSGSNADCVEVRAADGAIELRESDEGHISIRMSARRFAAFLQETKAGDFDHLLTTDA
ncbi:DUF397 domain-containing protein [Streptomyces sp. CBMA156]|uniref:DUF397 domain-containing protein n=1 Tax=Streptomyces sp. CBMA156 TaxID=1930280 RepID=UPI00166203AF|nr:DUF397 domain-containing protein [Streptomyces sp. CBMA156]MBD0671120.1 DUF397 domain-containing protein [Streptomyces sp. CBMA156]